VVRAVSSEGFGRLRYYTEVRRRLDADRPFRRYFDQETTELPAFYVDQIHRDLGPLWDWLPAGAIDHDPNAYRKSEDGAHLGGTGVGGMRPTSPYELATPR
ncbi:MAG TPA: hypothetical protein VGS00_11070, partial [Thermoanaerobaculia bacterium]|nr:hypothetical protein [Thermoanaerobaculia bacterium]